MEIIILFLLILIVSLIVFKPKKKQPIVFNEYNNKFKPQYHFVKKKVLKKGLSHTYLFKY
jgi:hypothetical protein